MKRLILCICFGFLLSVSSAMMTGGKRQQPLSILEEKLGLPDDKERTLGDLLYKAVDMYNKQVNSMFYHTIAKGSLKIYSQVVEGISYDIDANMVPTTCRKRGDKFESAQNLKECGILGEEEGYHPQPVHFNIWVRSWMPVDERAIITIKPLPVPAK